MFGDEMIDEASRKIALKFVSRGERAGLTRSAGWRRADERRAQSPINRRAITFSASVSSAPSKIDSTRASTK